jgi:hypothetical protein
LRQRATADLAVIRVHLCQHLVDIAAIGADRDEGAVLGRRAQHGRPADVDVLDTGLEVRAGGDRRLERVEVHVDQVDRADAVGLGVFHMGRVVAQVEQAAMHRRVQRLHAAVHHFRKARQVSDVFHLEPGVLQQFRRAAGGHEFDTPFSASFFGPAPQGRSCRKRTGGHGEYGRGLRWRRRT